MAIRVGGSDFCPVRVHQLTRLACYLTKPHIFSLMVLRPEFGTHEHLAVFCARLDYLQQGWRFVRLLDRKGKHTGATLLVRFTIAVIE